LRFSASAADRSRRFHPKQIEDSSMEGFLLAYTVDETHLSALLEGAKGTLSDASLRGRRLCAFQILDYYQVSLQEAATTLRIPASSEKLSGLVSAVLAAMPGLTDVGHVRGLPKFRNQLYHNEQFLPPPRTLERFLKAAERTRAALRKGAEDIAARRASMSDLSSRIDQALAELSSLISRSRLAF
jgi:hypothetical protein